MNREKIRYATIPLILSFSGIFAIWLTLQTNLPPADLVFDNLAEIQTLDPATANGQQESRILNFLFEGLTVAHPKTLAPLPGAASSWKISPDGKIYTFYLQERGRWSNEEPVTASDFVSSWLRLLHPRTGSGYAYLLSQVVNAEKYSQPELLKMGDPIEIISQKGKKFRGELLKYSMEESWIEFEENGKRRLEGIQSVTLAPEKVGLRALDERTFEVEFSYPVSYFLDLTYLWPLSPVHTRSIEAWRKRSPATWRMEWLKPENLIVNGPFRIEERQINSRIRFVKNPHYWDIANVRLNTIDALMIDSATTRLNLFETGALDWTQQIPISIIPDLLARDQEREMQHRNRHHCDGDCPNFRKEFQNHPFLAVYVYYFNVNRPPLNDRRVRLALSSAIDRSRITKYVTRAGQAPANSLIPPLIPGYQPAQGPGFNIQKARQLLAEAGFPEGKGFPVLEILYNTSEMHRDIAEVIQDQWRRNLGIEVKLLNQEWKTFLDAQITHNYSISRGSWIADYRDPNTFLEIFTTGNGNNRSGFSHPEYDRLLKKASLERDPQKRMHTLQEAEAILMQEAPVLPIFHYVTTHLVRPRLQGWSHNALDMHFPKFWSINPAQEGDS